MGEGITNIKGVHPNSIGPFEPYSNLHNLDEIVQDSYVCRPEIATDLLKQVCKEGNYFMVSALRNSANFREMLKYTDGMNFPEGKAVVLYPGSGYHVAPIAELGEELLKKFSLQEVEFIYTEIGGYPTLRRLKKALETLMTLKDWHPTSSSHINHDDVTKAWQTIAMDEQNWAETVDSAKSVLRNGGAFEEIFEIETPYGLIRVRFKNGLSRHSYYDEADLKKAHFFISHDLYFPHTERAVQRLVQGALNLKTDEGNFVVVAEDFTQAFGPPPAEAHFTNHPYGCSGAASHIFEEQVYLGKANTAVDPIDIGAMGLIDPKILGLQTLGYALRIDPNQMGLFLRRQPRWFEKDGNPTLTVPGLIPLGTGLFQIPSHFYDPKIFYLTTKPVDISYSQDSLVGSKTFDEPFVDLFMELSEPGYKRAIIIRK